MRDLVEYIIKQLVTKPDAVVVEEQVDGTAIQLYLTVDSEDMGLVIGKSGQTIKSVRKLLTVKAMADNVHVNLTLNEKSPVFDSEQAPVSDSEKSPVFDSEQAPSEGSDASEHREQSTEESADSSDVIPSEVEESSTPESGNTTEPQNESETENQNEIATSTSSPRNDEEEK